MAKEGGAGGGQRGFGKPKEPQGGKARKGGSIESAAAAQPRQSNSTREMMLKFTCNKCDGRNTFKINKVAYEEGVVICTCTTCGVRHLIADNQGLMDDADFGRGNLEQYMAAQGRSAEMTRTTFAQLDPETAARYDIVTDGDGNVSVMLKKKEGEGEAEAQ